jgi:hypothetical protein
MNFKKPRSCIKSKESCALKTSLSILDRGRRHSPRYWLTDGEAKTLMVVMCERMTRMTLIITKSALVYSDTLVARIVKV